MIKCQLSDLNYIDINNGGSTKKKKTAKKKNWYSFLQHNKKNTVNSF